MSRRLNNGLFIYYSNVGREIEIYVEYITISSAYSDEEFDILRTKYIGRNNVRLLSDASRGNIFSITHRSSTRQHICATD